MAARPAAVKRAPPPPPFTSPARPLRRDDHLQIPHRKEAAPMTRRDTTAFGGRLTTLTITVSLDLGVTACADGGREQDRPATVAEAAGGGFTQREQLQTDQPLAELQGPGGLLLTITSGELSLGQLRHSRVRGQASDGVQHHTSRPPQEPTSRGLVLSPRTGHPSDRPPHPNRVQTESAKKPNATALLDPKVTPGTSSCFSQLHRPSGKLPSTCVACRPRTRITAAPPGHRPGLPCVGGTRQRPSHTTPHGKTT